MGFIGDFFQQKKEEVTNSVNDSINETVNNSVEGVKESIKEGVAEATSNIWDQILHAVNNSIDGIALVLVMSTLLLNMMSVPNAGKWCYTIFAFYIVIKIMIKALLAI